MSLPARFMCSVSKRKAKARILLVGSGRMGVIRASIIHANPRMELCGIVDASTPDHLLEQYRVSCHESTSSLLVLNAGFVLPYHSCCSIL